MNLADTQRARTPSLSNYEALLALSTSPHMTDVMRGYIAAVLSEHRELVTAVRMSLGAYEALRITGAGEHLPGLAHCEATARAILAKVEGQP